MERIEITRADFEERFGMKPDPSSLGIMLYANELGEIPVAAAQYVFIDEALPCDNPKEVAELWRMFRL